MKKNYSKGYTPYTKPTDKKVTDKPQKNVTVRQDSIKRAENDEWYKEKMREYMKKVDHRNKMFESGKWTKPNK